MLTTSIKQTRGLLFKHVRSIYNRNKIMESFSESGTEQRNNFILQQMANEEQGIIGQD
jgi:hypothetical protein